LEIDDVNPVALTEDVFLHLGIPAAGLVAEVHSGLQQLLHGDFDCQRSSLIDWMFDGAAKNDSVRRTSSCRLLAGREFGPAGGPDIFSNQRTNSTNAC
jgi:hypothetical protein